MAPGRSFSIILRPFRSASRKTTRQPTHSRVRSLRARGMGQTAHSLFRSALSYFLLTRVSVEDLAGDLWSGLGPALLRTRKHKATVRTIFDVLFIEMRNGANSLTEQMRRGVRSSRTPKQADLSPRSYPLTFVGQNVSGVFAYDAQGC